MKTITALPGLDRYNWKYPWDQWTDGQVWELVRGEDFAPTIRNFRPQCYMVAQRRGMEIRTYAPDGWWGDRIQVQFYTPARGGK